MRTELLVALVFATSCAPQVVIGEERRLAVRTALVASDGRWREGGERTALVAPGDEVTAAAGWFGRSDIDGALRTVHSLPAAASAVVASAQLGALWVVAGHIGERGFVRALDDNDVQVWETSFEAEGTSTEVTAIATTNEGALVIAGTERTEGQATRGWTALLESDGTVRWRRSFETDFQRGAAGFVPLSIAADPGARSPSRRQYWLAGIRVRGAGDTPAYALQMTVDGDLWDSDALSASGSGRAIATFDVGLAVCVASEGGALLGWTQGGAVGGATVTKVALADAFELATCLATPTQVKLVGSFLRGAEQIPAVVTVERATRAVSDVREHPTARDVKVLGAAFNREGDVTAFGQSSTLVRRWRSQL